MRSIPFYPLMVLLLLGLGAYLGCDPNTIAPSLGDLEPTTASAHAPLGSVQNTSVIPPRTANSILIGSFNLQRLGPSKLGQPWVMDRFATIIRAFDVIALQEITSKDQTTLTQLVELVNQNGLQYAYVISPRVGRPTSGYYEQYAFVYDTTRIRGGAEFSYLVRDDADLLHREPFVGRFQTLFPEKPFQFSLINMHTDPDEVREELDVLAAVYRNVREFEYPEDDVILLGDLNAEPHRFQQLGEIPDLVPLITQPTNTRQNKSIDHILIDRVSTAEFTGRAGVMDLERMFGLQLSDVERISDHLPVWAEFSAVESMRGQAGLAGAEGALLR